MTIAEPFSRGTMMEPEPPLLSNRSGLGKRAIIETEPVEASMTPLIFTTLP
jgi:hypothetical protein